MLAVSHCRDKIDGRLARYTSTGVSMRLGSQRPSDHLPPHSASKDGRAIDSCFTLVGAHECGVLIVMLDDLPLLQCIYIDIEINS